MNFSSSGLPQPSKTWQRCGWLPPDRYAVTSAASIVDQLLAHDPDSQGEVRFDTVRSL
jgi:hypothetical protein